MAVPPVSYTVVGGPSRVLIQAAPVTLASFNSAGVTYNKVKLSTPQQYHGRNGGPGPFTHGGPGPSTYAKVAAPRASLGPTQQQLW